jgi:hypothetical protein
MKAVSMIGRDLAIESTSPEASLSIPGWALPLDQVAAKVGTLSAWSAART